MKLGQKQKSPAERREITLRALEIQCGLHPHTTIAELAREHGIQRSAIYQYLDSALYDPEGKLRDAEEEASFRRKVCYLLR